MSSDCFRVNASFSTRREVEFSREKETKTVIVHRQNDRFYIPPTLILHISSDAEDVKFCEINYRKP